jgi:hypothetical protein
MLSTPVCGVAMRKAVVAEVEAPLRRREMAVGRTPQEQSGSGTPRRVALSAGRQPRPERCCVMRSGRTKAWSAPAKRKPNKM